MSKIYESQVNIIIKYHLSCHFELNVYFQPLEPPFVSIYEIYCSTI